MSNKFPGNREEIKEAISKIFSYLGENGDREGLRDTPERIVNSWDKLFGGYLQNPEEVLTIFNDEEEITGDLRDQHNQIILLKDIEFYSTCEHHFLPFTGKAHVAYIPDDKVVGISKLARVVEVFARRLQLQERIGHQVTSVFMDYLNAKGAACVIEARHFCMTSRGVEKQKSVMVTSSLRGNFLKNAQTRQELMYLIKN